MVWGIWALSCVSLALFTLYISPLLPVSPSFPTPTSQATAWVKTNGLRLMLIWIQPLLLGSISGSCLLIRHTAGVTGVAAASWIDSKTAIFWLICQKEVFFILGLWWLKLDWTRLWATWSNWMGFEHEVGPETFWPQRFPESTLYFSGVVEERRWEKDSRKRSHLR